MDPIVGDVSDARRDVATEPREDHETGTIAEGAARDVTDAPAVVERDGVPGIVDACTGWTAAGDCFADSAHGCAFQPNSIGCHASDPACPAGVCMGGDPFVRRSGATLWLHGAPFTFLGAVSWGIAGTTATCYISSYPSQDEALIRAFDDLVDMRATGLRIWAFQSYAGPDGRDYSSFDKVVSSARRAGVRLIMVLENNRGDCTRGGQRDDPWFATGYRAPYGGYPLSFVDYVRGLVAHFRDEPTILAWELMHEASATDFAALDTFAEDVSSLIRLADPNHLISLGVNNGDAPATSNVGDPSNYQRLHDHPEIDLVDVHDLSSPDVALTPSMTRDAAIAAALGKPIFAGASAVSLASTSPGDFAARAAAMTSKITAAFSAGYVGFLIYDYYPSWPMAGWEFDGRAEEPLAGVSGILAANARPNR